MTPKKGAEIWRPIFLDALAETCNVSRACGVAEISRQTAYRHRAQYEGFAKEWNAALQIGVGALEDEAVRRAHEGVEKPVYYQGKVVGAIREYSDTLLIFLLKAHEPQKYRERLEHSTSDGKPLPIQIVEVEKSRE